MASEDNFLRLDPNNHTTELDSLLATSSFSLEYCESLYHNGKTTKEDFEYCKDWFDASN